MSNKLKLSVLALLVAVALGGVGIWDHYKQTFGNIADFAPPCATEDATTTLRFLRPGAGTTTLTCPIGATQRLQDNTAILHFIAIATSTTVAEPKLLARVEGSRNNVDWYPIAIPTVIGGTIATTTPYTTNPYNNLSFNISTSTTPAGDFGGTGTATRIHYSLVIPATEPYERVIFSSPTGGGVVGLWAEMYGKLPQ